jgi:hypothetical protein
MSAVAKNTGNITKLANGNRFCTEKLAKLAKLEGKPNDAVQ